MCTYLSDFAVKMGLVVRVVNLFLFFQTMQTGQISNERMRVVPGTSGFRYTCVGAVVVR